MNVIMSIKCIKLNFNFKMKGINSVANFKPKLYHTEQTLHFKYNNPCLTLQSYVEVPIFKDVNLFSPGFKSLLAAEDLFSPKSEHEISLISKTIDFEKFPNPNLPEVALIGPSNAGKSSLIKAILQNVPDIRVKTSKKPGHTKSINFFQVGSKLRLVDMPGYGERQPRWFEDIVFPFFQSSRNLVKIFLIVDGKVGLEESSEDMLKLLEEFKRPYCTVLNKIDKTSDSVRLRNLLHLQNFIQDNRLLYCHSHPFMLSSLTYEGLAYFLAFLGHITGNININE